MIIIQDSLDLTFGDADNALCAGDNKGNGICADYNGSCNGGCNGGCNQGCNAGCNANCS